jgi:hypothetical protein
MLWVLRGSLVSSSVMFLGVGRGGRVGVAFFTGGQHYSAPFVP